MHHADGATYGEETLEQAIARTGNVYSPDSEPCIVEQNGRYFRVKGDSVYPITNFIIRPLEMVESEDEAQMTCDLETINGETFRQTFTTKKTYRRTLMTERDIVAAILRLLKKTPGCFAWKEHGGMYGTAGIPDIIACIGGRFVAFEVKTPTGKLTKLQESRRSAPARYARAPSGGHRSGLLLHPAPDAPAGRPDDGGSRSPPHRPAGRQWHSRMGQSQGPVQALPFPHHSHRGRTLAKVGRPFGRPMFRV